MKTQCLVIFPAPIVQNFSKLPSAHLRLSRYLPRKSLSAYPAINKKISTRLNALGITTNTLTAPLDDLLRWCIETHSLPPPAIEPSIVDSEIDQKPTTGLVTNKVVGKGEILLEISGDLAITSADVQKDPDLAALAEDRSELVGLALFLIKERSKNESSPWHPLLKTLPLYSNSPLLWTEEELTLLRGSPVLQRAQDRRVALLQEWKSIKERIESMPSSSFPPSIFNEESFLHAMSIIFARAIYLPTAQCFALLPLLSAAAQRTGSAGGAVVDYDLDREAVTLVAARPYAPQQEVKLYDGRPNGELFLATGTLEPNSPSDFMTLSASLVAADRLYTMKKQILEEFGFESQAEFPIYEDRIAIQHLAYLRLARLTDAAQFAKITFEDDVIVSPENEYEVLQLVMGDLRELLQGYGNGYEDDVKELQRNDLSERERMAALLRASEKRILRGTMDGVRRRLAPIRGIPTKDGTLADPNADFKEIFDTLESIPTAPKKFFDGLASWARGEQDPDWGSGKKQR